MSVRQIGPSDGRQGEFTTILINRLHGHTPMDCRMALGVPYAPVNIIECIITLNMDNQILQIAAPDVRSLLWSGDRLVDWVRGGHTYGLDGSVTEARVHWGYRFDAVVGSPCGTYVVIFEKLGTKGLVLQHGKILREINRSYYHADDYEYPIVIFQSASGRVLMAHCPEDYCRIDIDDIETGERLTASLARKPSDFFHSRLRVSPDGRWLLSAGWAWHPWGHVQLFDLDAALHDAALLDSSAPIPEIDGEVSAAEFLPDSRVLVSTSEETLNGEDANPRAIGANTLAIFVPESQKVINSVPVTEPVGTLMAVDAHVAVGFFNHPKLISLETGAILQRWDSINSGNQTCSIIWDGISAPPIAGDPARRRFAVAEQACVSFVQLPADTQTIG